VEKFAGGVACEADRASVQRGKEGEGWKGAPAPQDADDRAGYRMAARTATRAVITSFSRCWPIGRSRYCPAGRSVRPYSYASALLPATYSFAAVRAGGAPWLRTFPRKRLVHRFTKRVRGNVSRDCVIHVCVRSCRISRVCLGQSGWRSVMMVAGGPARARACAAQGAGRPVPAGHAPDQVRRVDRRCPPLRLAAGRGPVARLSESAGGISCGAGRPLAGDDSWAGPMLRFAAGRGQQSRNWSEP